MSTAAVLEIVELPGGEVVLRRTDASAGSTQPLVTISFSPEAREFLGNYAADVGRGMIGAGMQIVSQLQAAEQAQPAHAGTTVH